MDATEAKILIVDNDEHVLIALERELENEGYRTVTAWSGQEALGLLRGKKV
jgi:CheY-like chemotaxis protein